MAKSVPIEYQAQCVYDQLTAEWQPWRMTCEDNDISPGSQNRVRQALAVMPGVELRSRTELSKDDTAKWPGFHSKHWVRLNQDLQDTPPDTASTEMLCKEEAVKHLRPLITRYGADVVRSAYLKTIDYLAS